MLLHGERHITVELGNWVNIPDFHFRFKLVFDRLSIPFVILTFALCGTVGAFCVKYLHREPGYHRFFILYAIFVMGMILTASAGTIETLFVGWEFVGLSSAFLVAFFHERPSPTNSQPVNRVSMVPAADVRIMPIMKMAYNMKNR